MLHSLSRRRRPSFACAIEVQLCAENITTLGRAQLEDVIGEMRANVTANDPAAYVDAPTVFIRS
ncbi:hypothetical protein [Caballeronia sp. dw_19]|uniref:hypothetical protein n=1 Tax=Caballeronia sp. dw_19 TaxID=2719791 RepID=UPI002107C395|nr:hypothetical protein [Caballeronia sp. dw_19]